MCTHGCPQCGCSVSRVCVDTRLTKYEQGTQLTKPRKGNQILHPPWTTFSTSCSSVWSALPGQVQTKFQNKNWLYIAAAFHFWPMLCIHVHVYARQSIVKPVHQDYINITSYTHANAMLKPGVLCRRSLYGNWRTNAAIQRPTTYVWWHWSTIRTKLLLKLFSFSNYHSMPVFSQNIWWKIWCTCMVWIWGCNSYRVLFYSVGIVKHSYCTLLSNHALRIKLSPFISYIGYKIISSWMNVQCYVVSCEITWALREQRRACFKWTCSNSTRNLGRTIFKSWMFEV